MCEKYAKKQRKALVLGVEASVSKQLLTIWPQLSVNGMPCRENSTAIVDYILSYSPSLKILVSFIAYSDRGGGQS
jgi:hypothetical protein